MEARWFINVEWTGGTYETIDEFDTEEEADTMMIEYAEVYDWAIFEIWISIKGVEYDGS